MRIVDEFVELVNNTHQGWEKYPTMSDTLLKVHVNPRSSRNQVTGWKDECLSIKITAPPVEGAANKACIEFLAELLGVKKGQLTLVSGATSRDKLFMVEGLTQVEVDGRLESRQP
jgi:uncharacterized protein